MVTITSQSLSGDVVFVNGQWYGKLNGSIQYNVSWTGGSAPWDVAVNVTSNTLDHSTYLHQSITNPPAATQDISPYVKFVGAHVVHVLITPHNVSGQATGGIPFAVRESSDPIFGPPGGGGGGGIQTLGTILLQETPSVVSDQTTLLQFSGVTKDTTGAFIGNVPLTLIVDGTNTGTVIATSNANGVFSFVTTTEATRTYQLVSGSVTSNAVTVTFQTTGGGGGGGTGGGGGGNPGDILSWLHSLKLLAIAGPIIASVVLPKFRRNKQR